MKRSRKRLIVTPVTAKNQTGFTTNYPKPVKLPKHVAQTSTDAAGDAKRRALTGH